MNCAGRTRSILGAQTLINFGVPNPVYALENGTQGWYLSDLQARARSARASTRIRSTQQRLPALKTSAHASSSSASRSERRTPRQVETWLKEPDRTTYLCDVRTPEEFKAGSIPGAVHAPGGQLIQATDQWVGVRNARIVLIDGGENVRAPVVASWLKQLGCDAWVLEGGVSPGLKSDRPPTRPALPALATISAAELKTACSTRAIAPYSIWAPA